MIILDTNVLSALMRPAENLPAMLWADSQPRTVLWTTVLTVMEIRYGVLRMPPGRRRSFLEAAFEGLLETVFADRILPFDRDAAERTATLTANAHSRGRNIDQPDSQIAGIAVSRRAVLATRNMRDFQGLGIELVNPWAA